MTRDGHENRGAFSTTSYLMIQEPEMLFDGEADASTLVILAHGTGAPMDSPFLSFFARQLAHHDCLVARFEFPYMAARRQSAERLDPDHEPRLRQTWRAAIRSFRGKQVIIGGKSMGARIASQIADEADVAGLICLGYPFYPPGEPERIRTKHLTNIKTPTLIVQGTRDEFGEQEEVVGYSLSECVKLHWLEDGDHGFKPRRVSGRSQQQNWMEAVHAINRFRSALPSA